LSYTVWIKIEDDDGQPGDPDEAWWSVTTTETRDEAIKQAEAVADDLNDRFGFDVTRIDD
jgi:hypothetical protein